LKDDVVTRISVVSGVDYERTNHIIAQWASSSNDNNPQSLSIQQEASAEFGVPLSKWQQEKMDANQEQLSQGIHNVEHFLYANGTVGKRTMSITTDQERAVLRSIYAETQKALEEQGLGPDDYVVVYRGMMHGKVRYGEGDTVDYKGNAMESWSLSHDTAYEFAASMDEVGNFGTVFRMLVPRRNIVSTAYTGFGCLGEDEVVIFGSVPGNEAYVRELVDMEDQF